MYCPNNPRPSHVIFVDPHRGLWRRKRFTARRWRIFRRFGVDALIEELSVRAGQRFDVRSGHRLPKN